MSGLEVFNSRGVSKFNTGSRLTRFLTAFTLSSASGARYVPGLNTGEPNAIAYLTSGLSLNTSGPPLVFNKETQMVTWSGISGTWSVFIYVY